MKSDRGKGHVLVLSLVNCCYMLYCALFLQSHFFSAWFVSVKFLPMDWRNQPQVIANCYYITKLWSYADMKGTCMVLQPLLKKPTAPRSCVCVNRKGRCHIRWISHFWLKTNEHPLLDRKQLTWTHGLGNSVWLSILKNTSSHMSINAQVRQAYLEEETKVNSKIITSTRPSVHWLTFGLNFDPLCLL